jgi:hypothetical protein
VDLLEEHPGPDRYLLRAVVELDRALDTGVGVDAAHAVLSDLATHVLGPGWQAWYADAIESEGLLGDPVPLLTDDDLADRVLARLRDRMRTSAGEAGTPPRPGADLVWSATSPRHTRQRLRRAAGIRRRAVAMLQPRRPDVAGERSRRPR